MSDPTASWRGAALALALGGLVSGCSALPPMPPRTATHAIDAATPSRLAQRVAAERGAPGQSGFRLLSGGDDALASLMLLVESAQRTLDLQYYAVLNDVSSRVLLQQVRAAADRGVRVRLLVDDLATTGNDGAILRLTRHPRIEVRLYNPLPAGRMSVVTKIIGSLHDIPRINSRMHNKVAIADNALAVTGGRNIGDPYFLQTEEANFVDLDVLAAGPVVGQLSRMFDRFWNSELAYPAAALIPASAAQTASAPAPNDAAAAASAASAPAPLDAPARLPEADAPQIERRLAALRQGPLGLTWAPARLLADAPTKARKEGDPDRDETMFDDLGALLGSAQRDVLVVTPYFVPGDKGMAMIRGLRERGVTVRILTAALAATDAPIVHVGYARYRKALLDAGVELYELRPEFHERPQRVGGVHSRTNLHAKAIVIDARTVMVGSMNLDPRSDLHNTEMGVLMRSPAMADALQRVLQPVWRNGAYRVTAEDGGALRWHTTDRDGRALEYRHEPTVAWWKRAAFRLLGPLAPESML